MKCRVCNERSAVSSAGRCETCKRRAHSKRNAEKMKLRRAAKDPAALLHFRKKSAKKRGLEFTLTPATLPPIPAECPVFGRPFGGDIGPPSLDRVDSSKGYVPGNVRWISFRANTLKSNATAAELVAIVNYMLKHELLS